MAMGKRVSIVFACILSLLLISVPGISSAAVCSQPAKIVGDDYVPTSVQDAYNHASASQQSFTLQIAGDVNENLVLDSGDAMFDAGYDCGFSSIGSMSGFGGTITIRGGSAIFSNIMVMDDVSQCSFDNDNDTYYVGSCAPLPLDCDDNDSTIYPGAPEICDDKDNNCDGQVDEVFTPVDADGDGYYGPGSCGTDFDDDCNDNDATIHPNALDTPYDLIDQDCDGVDLTFAEADLESDNCTWCHGAANTWMGLHSDIPLSETNKYPYTTAPDNTCTSCHAATVSNVLPGHYGKTVRTTGNNMNAGLKINCGSCHDQVSNFHNFVADVVWPKVELSTPNTTCDSCHEGRATIHDNTVLAHDNRVINSGCAICHTSDTTFLGSRGSGTLISSADVDTLHRNDCELCHNFTGMTTDAGRVRQAIEQGLNGTPVTCLDCHDDHSNIPHAIEVGPNDLSWTPPYQLCSNCHAEANDWASILIEHDVPTNGADSCSTCHSSSRQEVIDVFAQPGNPIYCLDCHSDKDRVEHNIDHTLAGYVTAAVYCLECHDPNDPDPIENAIVVNTHSNNCLFCHTTPTGPEVKPELPQNGGNCEACHGADPHPDMSCELCHSDGAPKPLPLPHEKHVGSLYNVSCAKCHADTVSSSTVISDPALHNNGQNDVNLETGNYTPGTQACDNLYCHSDAQGGAPNLAVTWSDSTFTTCISCHGDLADPDPKLVSDPFKMTSNAHDVLASTKWIRQYPCDFCHYTTTDGGGVIKNAGYHVNQQLDVVINALWQVAGRPSPTYDSSPGVNNCDNLYCHSDGRTVNPVITNLNWKTSEAKCDTCHGHQGTCVTCHDGSDGRDPIEEWPPGKEWLNATPMYANTGPGSSNANSHVRHLQTNFSCEKCHFTTIVDADCRSCHVEGALPTGSMDETGHVDPAVHVNKAKDVVFADGGTYDPMTKTCSNTSCHNGAYEDPVWGGKVKCLTCHGTSGADIDDFDGTNATAARINMTEWETSGHGRQAVSGNYPSSGNPPANFPADNPCWHCHDRTVVHDDDDNPFRLQIHSQFEKRFEKECVYCHMEGTDTECLGCHNTTGFSLARQLTAIVPPDYAPEDDHSSYVDGQTSCLTANCHPDDVNQHNTDSGRWTPAQQADIKNQYVMMGVCLQCHDDNGENNERCNSCHTWEGDPADDPYQIGFDPDGTGEIEEITGSSKASSGHFGHKHWQTYLDTGKWKGGKFCWDCHDPHGDSNIYMIQDQVAVETEGKYGKPVTRAEVVFTKNNSGLDYANTEAPYTGICNVCHTNAEHYVDDYGDGHRASRKCTECHNHGFGGGHASGGDCNSCHDNKPIPNHLGFGLPRDCTKCHDGAILLRMDIMRQFNGQSHHVQDVEVTNEHCYECHWESTPEGLIDNDYHLGYNYKTYTTVPNSPSDLVIYGPETRPTDYQLGVTAVTFDATKIGTVDERAEVNKVTDHCLGCHSDQNNEFVPFGDCKTPNQYAWDRTSIAARYEESGTTTYGKSGSMKNIAKAYSAHGNAVANQGGWSATTGEDSTIPNTRNGTQNVQCFDCHSSHGSYTTGVTSSYRTFNGEQQGANLKETQAGKGGYSVTYRAQAVTDGISQVAPGAAQCFDCHENLAAGTLPWGYNSTFGATTPIHGYKDSPRFEATSTGRQERLAYRMSNNSNWSSHFKASAESDGELQRLCASCHDPHGVTPTLGGDMAYAVPLLKGTWMTSPYQDDRPNPTTGSGSRYNKNGPKLSQEVHLTASYSATDTRFAGLCLRCHPQDTLTSAGTPAWRSKDRVHKSVKGWGGNQHSFTCSKCHAPHVSNLPKLMVTNCLDGKHRTAVVSGGAPSRNSGSKGRGAFPAGGGYGANSTTYYTSPCHATQTGTWNNQLWNNVTPW